MNCARVTFSRGACFAPLVPFEQVDELVLERELQFARALLIGGLDELVGDAVERDLHRPAEHVGRHDRVPALVDLHGPGAARAFAFAHAAGPAAEQQPVGVAQVDRHGRRALERRLDLHGGNRAARLEVAHLAIGPVEHELVEVELGPHADLLEPAPLPARRVAGRRDEDHLPLGLRVLASAAI